MKLTQAEKMQISVAVTRAMRENESSGKQNYMNLYRDGAWNIKEMVSGHRKAFGWLSLDFYDYDTNAIIEAIQNGTFELV